MSGETSAFFHEAVLFEVHQSAEMARRWIICGARHDACRWLADLLLWMPTGDRDAGAVRLSQEGASKILNVRRTTVAATVRQLDADGAIVWRRGGARILDRDKLQ